ncbi:hypothetical protein SDC9_176326 [bioreactor metagenome]|uniref:Uncharacterized protein n=1 Tax=bioreactor metagenome TaxID=1076179 RepID=A0A645GPP6_9ZZZZ
MHRSIAIAHPAFAGPARLRTIKAHQMAVLRQSPTQPAACRCGPFTEVPGIDRILPDPRTAFAALYQQRNLQAVHTRKMQQQVFIRNLGPDQRHARMTALGQEIAIGIDHHPVPVPLQAMARELGLRHGNTGAGFDGVDPQFGNPALHVIGGVGHHISFDYGFFIILPPIPCPTSAGRYQQHSCPQRVVNGPEVSSMSAGPVRASYNAGHGANL